MSLSDRMLSRLQAWSTICAAVVVPLIIAFFGWQIQSNRSRNSLKKDYVGMAIQILATPDNKKNDALRTWAAKILERNSPIPFTPAVRNSFLQGKFLILSPIPKNLLSSAMMQPPKQWKQLPRKGKVTNGDLLKNYVENRGLFEQNAITLKYLQQTVRSIATSSTSAHTNGSPGSGSSHQVTVPESSSTVRPAPSASIAVQ